MKPQVLRSVLVALAAAAVVLVATFAAEMSLLALGIIGTVSSSGGLGASSAPDVAIPLAILVFVGTFGWRLIRLRRASARARRSAGKA